jgi:hypothetical protein
VFGDRKNKSQASGKSCLLTGGFHNLYSYGRHLAPQIKEAETVSICVMHKSREVHTILKQFYPEFLREKPFTKHVPIWVDNIKTGCIDVDWIKLAKVKVQ